MSDTAKLLWEALSSIPWGVCSICDAEHSWPDQKCDLLDN